MKVDSRDDFLREIQFNEPRWQFEINQQFGVIVDFRYHYFLKD